MGITPPNLRTKARGLQPLAFVASVTTNREGRLMPNQPAPGYHKQYARRRRAADRRLRQAHPDEWADYFEEERNNEASPRP
jgi:hypothetical protein